MNGLVRCGRPALLLLFLFAACAPEPHTVRFAMYPPRPRDRVVEWDPSLRSERLQDHESAGAVTVFGNDDDIAAQRPDVRVEACRLGGDVVAFSGQTASGSRSGSATFFVLRRKSSSR